MSTLRERVLALANAADIEHESEDADGNRASYVSDIAIEALALAVMRMTLEAAAQEVKRYLSYDSQRAVSWHEVNDAIDAIRKLGGEG